MTRAEIIAALQAALDSRESALIVWSRVKPAVRDAIMAIRLDVWDAAAIVPQKTRCDQDKVQD